MPTYEYRCDACQNELEEFQYINDPPLKKCPVCGKNKLKRLISGGAAIVFKGSGFYQTDYRSDSYKKAAAKSSDSGSSSAPSTETASSTPSSTSSALKEPKPSETSSKSQNRK